MSSAASKLSQTEGLTVSATITSYISRRRRRADHHKYAAPIGSVGSGAPVPKNASHSSSVERISTGSGSPVDQFATRASVLAASAENVGAMQKILYQR